MKKWGILGVVLAALLMVSGPAATANGALPTPRFAGFGTTFELKGTNGYDLWVSAFSRRRDGDGWIVIVAGGKHSAAAYRVRARVRGDEAGGGLATSIEADLGKFGRIDLLLNRSGREESFRFKCGGHKETFEPGVYEGTFEFEGEGGYTRVATSSIPYVPTLLFRSITCSGSGSGESAGPGVPGARLKGLSFAHDRVLTFQVNKNNRHSRVVYSASVREQRDGIYIDRTTEGTAGPGAFLFEPHLRSATLRPPAPFSGSATARRDSDSLLLQWQGNLELAFPGETVPLAGPGVHVSLAHAHLTQSDSANVVVGS